MDVEKETPEHSTGDDAPALFLVELRAGGIGSADVDGMRRALMFATERLNSAGLPIHWGASVLVCGDSRCLCFVEAGHESHVVRARDIAGVASAMVRQIYPVPEKEPQP